MQLNPLTQENTWRHRHHGRYTMSSGRVPSTLEFHPSSQASTVDHLYYTPSPWDQRPHLYGYYSLNSTALGPTQQETLALQTQADNSIQRKWQHGVALQKSEAQEEIVPGDIRYRLEPLVLAPLQMQTQHSSSLYFKPRWLPFSTTHGDYFMPWKSKPDTYIGEKPYHSGTFLSPGQIHLEEYSKKQGFQPSLLHRLPGNVWLQGEHNMTAAHQISFQSPPLGLSILPIHTQGRKVAPMVHKGHTEYVTQHLSDFQAPAWSRVLTANPDKHSQRINKYIQHVLKETARGQQRTSHTPHPACVHQEPGCSKQETTIPDGKNKAKLDGNTVTRISYLPPLKPMVKRVKGKFRSNTLGVFKAKFQPETTSKQYFQAWGPQPHVHQGPHYRGNEKSPGSQAPPEDKTTSRTTYMPLFSERLKLYKPQIDGIKSEARNFSTRHRKSFRPAPELGSQKQDIKRD